MKNSTSTKSILFCLAFLAIFSITIAQQTGDYPISPVEFTQVNINDQFWKPWLELNKNVTIPSSLKKCEETGRIENFEVAAGLKPGAFRGVFPFDDSDVYKIIEGASYSLTSHPDPALSTYLDTIISYIAAAQQPDGYLQTWVIIDPTKPPTDWSGTGRWTNIGSGHELYDAGHLYEAAVAHYKATGKRALLDVAIKNADLIVETFGPNKMITVTGHQEIEIGLAKLYRVTGNAAYLNLAKFFLDHRGQLEGRDKLFGEYSQDHIPVQEQTEAVGHAVRAGYMYTAMADIAAMTGDQAYLNSLEHIWNNVVSKKLYLTGGIGARHQGESFGDNYELPNQTAYNETCAAIANIFWNHRMFLLTGDSKYIDVLERTLYNGMLAGLSLEGDHFFYPNPLFADGIMKFNIGSCTRSPWFDCSCCPSNVTRFIPSIPGYVYATKDHQVFVNLFVSNTSKLVVDGNNVGISQSTEYPWNNTIIIKLDPENEINFDLKIRIPGWAKDQVLASDLYSFQKKMNRTVSLKINGKNTEFVEENGYAVLNKTWNKDDQVEVSLPMEIRRVVANQMVEDDKGKVAIECGPLVYCAEGIDNTEDVLTVALPKNASFTEEYKKDFLGGVRVISADLTGDESKLTLIPYYAWSNRGVGTMTVWMNDK
jgi:DUF1680 family protein